MFNLIEAAGWPIWLLIISSLIAVTLIVERLIYLRRQNIIPAKLLDEVVHELKQRGVSPQMLERLYAGSPLGKVSCLVKRCTRANWPSAKHFFLTHKTCG